MVAYSFVSLFVMHPSTSPHFTIFSCQSLHRLRSRLGLQNTSTASLLMNKPTPDECRRYDTKRSDDEIPVILELCGMQGTTSLPSLPGHLCLGVLTPDKVLSMGQIEVNCVLMLNWIAWNKTVFDIKTLYVC